MSTLSFPTRLHRALIFFYWLLSLLQEGGPSKDGRPKLLSANAATPSPCLEGKEPSGELCPSSASSNITRCESSVTPLPPDNGTPEETASVSKGLAAGTTNTWGSSADCSAGSCLAPDSSFPRLAAPLLTASA
ncbi:hypothetical protein SKAU_G00289660 [Synaphobranchus kaupii]|uniref:Uncharacterized protein n=1 Tax=Synaphobranchus kaupii TaxID=118154 RepID=A0A9Q1IM58_SYNKA|nr:hypothetical protein SKAU_G00289660 [Synaphobranchus kaupii]